VQLAALENYRRAELKAFRVLLVFVLHFCRGNNMQNRLPFLSLAVLAVLIAVVSTIASCASDGDTPSLAEGKSVTSPVPATVPPPSSSTLTYDLSKRPVPLTESEKERVVEIALATPEARTELDKGTTYRAEFGWGAFLWEDDPDSVTTIGLAGTCWGLDYGIVDTGVPSFVNPKAVIYPRVVIRFGEPVEWSVGVTVDRTTWKIVRVDKSPPRKGIDLTIPSAPSR
jgi:hypothetical protein